MNKTLKFVKIKCQCGHVNLIPVTKTFRIYENIKCEKCGKAITEPNRLFSTKVNRDDKMPTYWKKKDGDRIHKYPVSSPCTAVWNGEPLYDRPEDVPSTTEKCDNCFPELPR